MKLSERKAEFLKATKAEKDARQAAVIIGALSSKELSSLRLIATAVESEVDFDSIKLETLSTLIGGSVIFQNFIESQLIKKGESRNSREIIKVFIKKREELEGLVETK